MSGCVADRSFFCANVSRNIIELFPPAFVEINQFPISTAYGTSGTDTGAFVAPYIRAIPVEVTFLRRVSRRELVVA